MLGRATGRHAWGGADAGVLVARGEGVGGPVPGLRAPGPVLRRGRLRGLSGSIFLSPSASWGPALWGATMSLGVLLVSAGWMVRNRAMSDRVLQATVGGLTVMVLLHGLLILWLAGEPQQTSYLGMLLAGAGYFLLPRP